MLPPKQDITVLVKTPSNLQPANTMKACSSQTFHHRQYCPSCFVSIATAALNLALPSPNKYKVAKLVENRCPWTVCQSHFCYTALFLFITLHQQFLSIGFQFEEWHHQGSFLIKWRSLRMQPGERNMCILSKNLWCSATAWSGFANTTVQQRGKEASWKVAVAVDTGTGCGAVGLRGCYITRLFHFSIRPHIPPFTTVKLVRLESLSRLRFFRSKIPSEVWLQLSVDFFDIFFSGG